MTKYDILSAMIITENIVARIIRQPFKDTQADPWSVYGIHAHLCFNKQ